MLCPKCNTVNGEDEKFCKNCGFQLNASRICPKCNTVNTSNSKYCENCGANLSPVGSFKRDTIEQSKNNTFLNKYRTILISALILILACGAVAGIAIYGGNTSDGGIDTPSPLISSLNNDNNDSLDNSSDELSNDDTNNSDVSNRSLTAILFDSNYNNTKDNTVYNNTSSNKTTDNKSLIKNNKTKNTDNYGLSDSKIKNKTNKSSNNIINKINKIKTNESDNNKISSKLNKTNAIKNSNNHSKNKNNALNTSNSSNKFSLNTLNYSNNEIEDSLNNKTGGDSMNNYSANLNEIKLTDVPNLAQKVADNNYDFSQIDYNGDIYTKAQCIDIFSKYIIKINTNNNDPIIIQDVKNASNSNAEDLNNTIEKEDYLSIANRVSSYIDNNGQVPNYVGISSSGEADLSDDKILYLFTQTVLIYAVTGELPDSVEI